MAITPTKRTEDSAGFDLYSVEDVSIPSNSIKLIKTDIGFKIPEDILDKFIPVLVWQLNALKLAEMLLSPSIEGPL